MALLLVKNMLPNFKKTPAIHSADALLFNFTSNSGTPTLHRLYSTVTVSTCPVTAIEI